MYPTLRKTRGHTLLLPVLVFLVSLITLYTLPSEHILFPRPLNYKSRYEAFYNSSLPRVSVSVPELYSTGLEYQKDSFSHFVFYYTLYENFCQFYLISEKTAARRPILDGQTLTGHLIQLNDSEYEALLSQMARELQWKKATLREYTSPYVIAAQQGSLLPELCRLFALIGLLLSGFDLLLLFRRNLSSI